MSPRAVVISAVVSVALAAVTAFVFSLSFERAAVLAPVIIVVAGAAAGVVTLWARVLVETLRRRKHPGRIVAAALAVLGLLMVVSLVVGPLPHE